MTPLLLRALLRARTIAANIALAPWQPRRGMRARSAFAAYRAEGRRWPTFLLIISKNRTAVIIDGLLLLRVRTARKTGVLVWSVSGGLRKTSWHRTGVRRAHRQINET